MTVWVYFRRVSLTAADKHFKGLLGAVNSLQKTFGKKKEARVGSTHVFYFLSVIV